MIEKLGQSGIKMLLFLLKNGECNKNTIRINAEMGVEGVLKAINELGKRNLISDRGGKGTETLYSLTPKGREIAELLKKADDLLLSKSA